MRPQSDKHPPDPSERERDLGDREDHETAPGERPDDQGAGDGAERPTSDTLPGMPSKDDPSPVGDTDQHSPG